MEIKTGDFVVAYDSYFQPVAGRVVSVSKDAVAVAPVQANTVTVHPDDCKVVEIPEHKDLETRLKPHAQAHRQRAREAAELAKKTAHTHKK